MIYYRPTDGDPYPSTLELRPRTCFLMSQLAQPLDDPLQEIHDAIREVCADKEFAVRDASDLVTGKDFLLNVWSLLLSVPVGIAVIHEGMPTKTIGNIVYELGMMQAYGKETVVVKTDKAPLPSDLVRTQYLAYPKGFRRGLGIFLNSVRERADYFAMMALQLDRNPLLSIDFLRRAFLITGDDELRESIKVISDQAGFEGRATNSVELLATQLRLASDL